MEAFHYIKHEHLVLRNKHEMCRFCLLPKTNMRRISLLELQRSKIPRFYEEVTMLKVRSSAEPVFVETVYPHIGSIKVLFTIC